MMGIRVAMLVKLSDVLELFVAYGAIERSEGFSDFGLNIRSSSDGVLIRFEFERATRTTRTRYTSLSARWSSFSLSKRSEVSSRRCETVVSIMRASWPYFPRPVMSCFTWNGMGSTRPIVQEMSRLPPSEMGEKRTITSNSQPLPLDPPQLHQHPKPFVRARDFRVDGDDLPLVPSGMLVVFEKIGIVDLHGIQRRGGPGAGGHVVVFVRVIGVSCLLGAKRREVSILRGIFLA